MTFNDGDGAKRVNSTQRPPAKPSEITKLGHVVLEVAEYQKTCAWYTSNFGFIPSDVQVLPDGSPLVTFMRLDLGDEPVEARLGDRATHFRQPDLRLLAGSMGG